jgi:hypothetical protein
MNKIGNVVSQQACWTSWHAKMAICIIDTTDEYASLLGFRSRRRAMDHIRKRIKTDAYTAHCKFFRSAFLRAKFASRGAV